MLICDSLFIERLRHPSKLLPLQGRLYYASLWIICYGILTLILPVVAEEECLFSRLWCYECDTTTDHRCKDPFNATAHPQDLPPLKRCEGCCVKIIRNQRTQAEVVQRTCLSNLQINLFLVDHVCMSQSDSEGTICFCESDACNSAPAILLSSSAFFYVLCAFLLSVPAVVSKLA